MVTKRKAQAEPKPDSHKPFKVWRVVRAKGGDYSLCSYTVVNGQLTNPTVTHPDLQAKVFAWFERESLAQVENDNAKDPKEFSGF